MTEGCWVVLGPPEGQPGGVLLGAGGPPQVRPGRPHRVAGVDVVDWAAVVGLAVGPEGVELPRLLLLVLLRAILLPQDDPAGAGVDLDV